MASVVAPSSRKSKDDRHVYKPFSYRLHSVCRTSLRTKYCVHEKRRGWGTVVPCVGFTFAIVLTESFPYRPRKPLPSLCSSLVFQVEFTSIFVLSQPKVAAESTWIPWKASCIAQLSPQITEAWSYVDGVRIRMVMGPTIFPWIRFNLAVVVSSSTADGSNCSPYVMKMLRSVQLNSEETSIFRPLFCGWMKSNNSWRKWQISSWW